MDRKWMITIVIAALLWAAATLPCPAPFVSRAEAAFRYIPLDAGDPDDVYWGPSPLPVNAESEAETPMVRPAEADLVHGQEVSCWTLVARLLSLIVFRP